MNSGLTSHQQLDHTEMGLRLNLIRKTGEAVLDFASLGFVHVVQRVIHITTAASSFVRRRVISDVSL